ncbi:hypothetical protein LOTGIDRAFT_168399 [Lottia gigantea]|uniref:Uncharacterized protein n=1 Tax=Lottia gigantea TaxID=225164 RepID=V3ZQF3_LOTGI|nr:hypothetical protein LOTGIDRAFT_168399 [Lottia gigantea]ESO84735.1 hypothetical protein LOTGIDRAFT_168399 [Lottia gigantea]
MIVISYVVDTHVDNIVDDVSSDQCVTNTELSPYASEFVSFVEYSVDNIKLDSDSENNQNSEDPSVICVKSPQCDKSISHSENLETENNINVSDNIPSDNLTSDDLFSNLPPESLRKSQRNRKPTQAMFSFPRQSSFSWAILQVDPPS